MADREKNQEKEKSERERERERTVEGKMVVEPGDD